jgi:hypothetical protein
MTENLNRLKDIGQVHEGDAMDFPQLPPGLSSIGELVAVIKDFVDRRHADQQNDAGDESKPND